MIQFSNSKLKKDGIGYFSLPAIKTCPSALVCKQKKINPTTGKEFSTCFGTNGFYNMPNVKASHKRNFEMSKRAYFTDMMCDELETHKKKLKYFRPLGMGDFYNLEYFEKWIAIVKATPWLNFYSYTKRVSLVKTWIACGNALPDNLRLIYSVGGTEDHLIDFVSDNHAVVFSSVAELKLYGYHNCSKSDLEVYKSNRCGLVYMEYNKLSYKDSGWMQCRDIFFNRQQRKAI